MPTSSSPKLSSEAYNFRQRWKRLLRIDSIRGWKLFEILYYTLLSYIIGYVMGVFTNKLFEYKENLSTTLLFFYIMYQSIVMVIIYYAVRKVIQLIPFVFNFSSSYISSLKGESILGADIGLSFIFTFTQKNLMKNMKLYLKRIKLDKYIKL